MVENPQVIADWWDQGICESQGTRLGTGKSAEYHRQPQSHQQVFNLYKQSHCLEMQLDDYKYLLQQVFKRVHLLMKVSVKNEMWWEELKPASQPHWIHTVQWAVSVLPALADSSH